MPSREFWEEMCGQDVSKGGTGTLNHEEASGYLEDAGADVDGPCHWAVVLVLLANLGLRCKLGMQRGGGGGRVGRECVWVFV